MFDMSKAPQPDEEKYRRMVETAARVTGWVAGFGISTVGVFGTVYCLLHWTSFLFGYHYFGLWEWRIAFFFFLILIYAGVTVLRSSWRMRKEELRRK